MLFAACLAMLCAGVAGAQASALSVQDAWIRAIPGADVAAAYMTVQKERRLRLAPGGLHVMLQALAHPLTPGTEVPLVLLLEGGGSLAVTARVRPLSAR